MRRLVAALALTAALAVPVVSAPSASASSHDCIILGPNYVDEVVDCAIFIIERAIG